MNTQLSSKQGVGQHEQWDKQGQFRLFFSWLADPISHNL